MKQITLAAALALLSAPALAQSPMSGDEFDAYATGKTLEFSSMGTPYGAEQYLSGRRVRWAFSEDICMEGIWYQQGDEICFEYDDGTGPQCWRFYRDGAGIRAQFSGLSGTELYEANQTDEPLACIAPNLGA